MLASTAREGVHIPLVAPATLTLGEIVNPKVLQNVAACAWFAAYAVLAVRSAWALLPVIGLVCGVLVFWDRIVALTRALDGLRVIVLAEFARKPAPREIAPEPVELPDRPRQRKAA